jgi:hypothetical protein
MRSDRPMAHGAGRSQSKPASRHQGRTIVIATTTDAGFVDVVRALTFVRSKVARPTVYASGVMDAREKMNVGLGRTSLVVAASDGPGG